MVKPTRLKIHVAEDEPDVRQLITGSMEYLGHEASSSEDGVEAWRVFKNQGFDILITDWCMPRMDGLELCKKIRSADEYPQPYIIVCSGHFDTFSPVEIMEAGANDWMNKPFSLFEIERTCHFAEHTAVSPDRHDIGEAYLCCKYCKQIKAGDSRMDVEEFMTYGRACQYVQDTCPECAGNLVQSYFESLLAAYS